MVNIKYCPSLGRLSALYHKKFWRDAIFSRAELYYNQKTRKKPCQGANERKIYTYEKA